MEQISKVKKCYSCGATLQKDDPSAPGYVLPEIFDGENQYFIFCKKCFELERFRSTSNEPIIDEDFIKIMNEAKNKDALIVYVINLYSFETSFSKAVVSLLNGMKLMVVGMKFDLLPKNSDREKIAEYVAHRFRVAGIKIQSNDVSIVSKEDDENIKDVMTHIYQLKNNKDVYVIGSTSSGKSSLIAGFLRNYSNLSSGNISTHKYKDTNLKVMEIPLNKTTSLYETPGITITNSILHEMDAKTAKYIIPNKNVYPQYITLKEGQSLFVGGLAVIELVEGPRTEIRCYLNDLIELNKSHVWDIEKKFLFLSKNQRLIPSLSKISSTKDMEVFNVKMQESDKRYRDIGISGLGWFSMRSMNQSLRIYLPKGVSIYTSRPKIEEN